MLQRASLLCVALATSSLASAQFDPPTALDINPSPTIVEVNLSAKVANSFKYFPGINTQVWGYSDDSPGGAGFSIPGPVIRANVDDTVIVHFKNMLPEATTVHWHGIEVPANMDGSHVSQLHVQPGGTFDYQFQVLSEGLYWYHPHVRTFDQVEKGLYGLVMVKDPAKDAIVFANLGGRAVEEHIVVFDDILLDASMQVVPAFSFTDPLQNALYQLNGRVGNHLLVNGKLAQNVTLQVPNGAVQVWHCLNAANTTFAYVKLSSNIVGGNGMPADIYEIGSDGGYVEYPFKRFSVASTAPGPEDHPEQILIPESYSGLRIFPGERMTLAFTPIGANQQTFQLENWDWFRGRHIATQPGGPGTAIMLPDDPLDGNYPIQNWFKVRLNGPNPGLGEWVPNFFLPFPVLTGTPPSIPYTFGHGAPDPNTGDVTIFAQAKMVMGNMVPLPNAKVDSFEAHDVSVGDEAIWEVTNLTHGDHNFHTHGFFFELLDTTWTDPLLEPSVVIHNVIGAVGPFAPPRKRKDVIRIPARTGAKGMSNTVTRLRVHFDDTGRSGQVVAEGKDPTRDVNGNWTSGGWLVHCHILEHSARGMLSFYELRDPQNPYSLLGKHLPGTHGNPYLTGRSPLLVGNDLELDLVNALESTNAFLIVGATAGRMPIFGGEVVPGIPAVVVPVATDTQGEFNFSLAGWEPLPPGTPVWFQVILPDINAVQNVAMSNAVRFNRP